MEDILFFFEKGFNFSQDGPGNRLVIHLSGCNLICPWCSNPEGMVKSDSTKSIAIDELFKEIVSCKMMFFENGGVTFTGGEISLQSKPLLKLFEMLKKEGISTCIETNASLKESGELLLSCDYAIADFKSPDKEILKSVTGADIEIIKKNLLKRAETKKPLLLRIPLINGFNNGIDNAKKFASYFSELQLKSNSDEIYIEILTYHEYGKEKWEKVGKEYKFNNGFVPEADVKILKNELEKYNLKIIKT